MQVKLDLNGATVNTGFAVLPSGIYQMKIISSEPKQTKSGQGYYLEVGFEVMYGEHSGKTIVDRLNIKNSNPDTQRWAYNTLKTILTMGGHKNPNWLEDTDEMIGLMLRVSVEEVQTTYVKDGETKEGKQNNIKGYFKVEDKTDVVPLGTSSEPTTPVTNQTSQPQPQQAEKPAPAAGSFPWA